MEESVEERGVRVPSTVQVAPTLVETETVMALLAALMPPKVRAWKVSESATPALNKAVGLIKRLALLVMIK
jgi:hypothetical protein